MTAHSLFDPDCCNVASGREKGRVEKRVQDNRRRIRQVGHEQRFGTWMYDSEFARASPADTRDGAAFSPLT